MSLSFRSYQTCKLVQTIMIIIKIKIKEKEKKKATSTVIAFWTLIIIYVTGVTFSTVLGSI